MRVDPNLVNADMTTPHRLSLNALRAFETTARLRSFSAAAEELSVTHGAVSRQIRMLEDLLGLALLQRTAQGAIPTPEGQNLADGLSKAFGLIQSSVEQLKPGPLTLACSESIMMYWLIPRLSRFKEVCPEVDLRFNMSHGPINFAHDSVSVAIRLSSIEPPKEAVRVDAAHEWIGPVCSSEYLRHQRIESIEDLNRARLMTSRTRPTAWTDWCSCSGQTNLNPLIDDEFDHFYLLIQGARCGLGLANVPRMLVRDDLTSGTLVAPLGFVRGPNRLSIWIAPHLSRRPEVVKLVDWLHDELRATEPQRSSSAP